MRTSASRLPDTNNPNYLDRLILETKVTRLLGNLWSNARKWYFPLPLIVLPILDLSHFSSLLPFSSPSPPLLHLLLLLLHPLRPLLFHNHSFLLFNQFHLLPPQLPEDPLFAPALEIKCYDSRMGNHVMLGTGKYTHICIRSHVHM